MLRAAGLEVAAQETQHAGHASQMAADLDLGRTAALVMVGGDGTVFEALQARARCWPPSVVTHGQTHLVAHWSRDHLSWPKTPSADQNAHRTCGMRTLLLSDPHGSGPPALHFALDLAVPPPHTQRQGCPCRVCFGGPTGRRR